MAKTLLEIYNYENKAFFNRLLGIVKAPMFYGMIEVSREQASKEFEDLLVQCLKDSLEDKEIYHVLAKYVKEELHFQLSDKDQANQAKNKAASLFKFLPKGLLPSVSKGKRGIQTYLDYGCADGSLTEAIKNRLHLKDNSVFGVDVKAPLHSYLPSKQLVIIKDTALPFKDNSFDLITCLMTLHHVGSLKETLKELFRVMRPEGRLFLKEHDLQTNAYQSKPGISIPKSSLQSPISESDAKIMTLILNAQHSFYDQVWCTEEIGGVSLEETKYHSIGEWDLLFEEAGFVPLYLSYYQHTSKNPSNKFVRVYGKP